MSVIKYSNPPLAYRYGTSDHRAENREFGRLLMFVAALLVALLFTLDRVAAWVAPRMPFAWEMALAQTTRLDTWPVKVAAGSGAETVTPQRALQIEKALQQRADAIAKTLDLPADMRITAHFVDSKTVNAVATLGGHITVFSGLLRELEYAEELDAVLAHEIGHVRHRHMVQHLSRGVAIATGLGLIGVHSRALNQWLLGDIQQLQQLAYSRDAEREADAVATTASIKLYGHTQGMARLFERFRALQEKQGGGKTLEIFQSHPQPENRIRDALAQASKKSSLTLLDPVFKLPAQPQKQKL